MATVIRDGKPQDISAVYSLIEELAEYENEPESVVINEQELLEDAFGSKQVFNFLVAESDQKIVGAAIYYYCYSTWRGKYIYLEDLIVTEKFRRSGIGSQLFEALIERTKAEGLRQIGWQVLDWNQPAIEFYKKYSAKLDGEWINGRLYFD